MPGRENAGRAAPKKWEWWDGICHGGRDGHRDKAPGAFFLPDGNLQDIGMEDIMRFAAANGIVRILADIPGKEGVPEQYGRLGFRRAYLYRCYQKK